VIFETRCICFSLVLFAEMIIDQHAVLPLTCSQARFQSKNVRGAKTGLYIASLSTLCHMGLKHAEKYSSPVG